VGKPKWVNKRKEQCEKKCEKTNTISRQEPLFFQQFTTQHYVLLTASTRARCVFCLCCKSVSSNSWNAIHTKQMQVIKIKWHSCSAQYGLPVVGWQTNLLTTSNQHVYNAGILDVALLFKVFSDLT
jgi:hypothetical protein